MKIDHQQATKYKPGDFHLRWAAARGCRFRPSRGGALQHLWRSRQGDTI